MDIYIDNVCGEIRSSVHSERSDDVEPLPARVAVCFGIGSLGLASCWVAMTCDAVKFLRVYGPHSVFFMQLGYFLPVLPIALLQKNMGDTMSRKVGTRASVLSQSMAAFIGNGLMCSLWEPIMKGWVRSQWQPWFACTIVVGVFSATGYGALMFVVRLLDLRVRTWFVGGFAGGGAFNLAILLATGGPLFSTARATPDSDRLYYSLVGALIWVGLACTLVALLLEPSVASRMRMQDAVLAARAAPSAGSSTDRRPSIRDVLLAHDPELLAAVASMTLSFICSVACFAMIAYVPSPDCTLPLTMTYVATFSGIVGGLIPSRIASLPRLAAWRTAASLILVICATAQPKEPGAGPISAETAVGFGAVGLGLSSLIGGKLSRDAFALAAIGGPLATTGTSSATPRVAALSLSIFVGAYVGFALVLVLIASGASQPKLCQAELQPRAAWCVPVFWAPCTDG